ncbi:hypothetical protein [Nocardioides sp. YIM 152315]|uniref:hypothetical protein n=1 Tax=Nocardioides sp. YIM 152315 TaxID=3031760 RepID=UPI0023DB5F89|nr:hypothetical protein [Nocardioides sp. YIM 152315]MDF1606394.1 hypothetical protein [Nocardioides sp. YIM 152315]
MTLVSSTLVALAIAFIVLAAVLAAVSVGVIADFVVTNRRSRLARRESFRSYYRGLVASH